METIIYYALSGAAVGWLFIWMGDRKGMQIFNTILLGAVGGIAGGWVAEVLIAMASVLAPLAGGVLGAFVLLFFVRETQAAKKRQGQ
ncbi:MAG: hypothetical protein VCA55_16260 [Verrucomicrobiales bacterium]